MVEPEEPLDAPREGLLRTRCAVRDGHHGPLQVLHLGHRQRVDLALGHHDHLALVAPEVLAVEAAFLQRADDAEVLVLRADLLRDERGAVLRVDVSDLDRLAVILRNAVAELPAGGLSDARLGEVRVAAIEEAGVESSWRGCASVSMSPFP